MQEILGEFCAEDIFDMGTHEADRSNEQRLSETFCSRKEAGRTPGKKSDGLF